MSDSTDWLDAQTKAHLQKVPPDRLAPATVIGYSLVLLERGSDHERVRAVLGAVADEIIDTTAKCPLVIRRSLSLSDALLGQFELICADSISIFVDDNVVQFGEPSYLHELFETVHKSDEFAPVTVHLSSVPENEDSQRFLRQFFGQVLGVPPTHVVARKKARIMAHWGARFGIKI